MQDVMPAVDQNRVIQPLQQWTRSPIVASLAFKEVDFPLLQYPSVDASKEKGLFAIIEICDKQ